MDKKELEDNLRKLIDDAKKKWGLAVEKKIKQTILDQHLLNTGDLLQSVESKLEGEDIQFDVAPYAKYQDEGTGTFGPSKTAIPKEKAKGMAHYLKDWAVSKGLNEYAVAYSIIKRGGLRPRPFYKSVIEAMVPELETFLNEAYKSGLDKIVEEANKEARE